MACNLHKMDNKTDSHHKMDKVMFHHSKNKNLLKERLMVMEHKHQKGKKVNLNKKKLNTETTRLRECLVMCQSLVMKTVRTDIQ